MRKPIINSAAQVEILYAEAVRLGAINEKRPSHLGKAKRKTVEVKNHLCFYRVLLGKIKVKT